MRAGSRLPATAISAERPKSAGNELVSTAAEVPHQAGIEKRTASIRQISTKPNSQPSKPHLSKESSGKHTTQINPDSSAPAAAGSHILSELGDVNPSSDSLNAPHTLDALQVAAQTYPWLYMGSMLDACFTKAEQSAKRGLDFPECQVPQGEADFADEKALYESQRLIEFCDEPNSSTFAKGAPAVMQSFMTFGEICERTEAETLQLAMAAPNLESEEPLQVYNAMMDRLDNLQEQASKLESSILSLTESNITTSTSVEAPPQIGAPIADNERAELEDTNSAREQIMSVFVACLPVLRARKANLTMAQELIDSMQENISLALRMESMGIH